MFIDKKDFKNLGSARLADFPKAENFYIQDVPNERGLFESPDISVIYQDAKVSVLVLLGHYNGWHYGLDITVPGGGVSTQCKYSRRGKDNREAAEALAVNEAIRALSDCLQNATPTTAKAIKTAVEACRKKQADLTNTTNGRDESF